MDESPRQPAYLIFDVEAVADGELVKNVRYSNDGLTSGEAISRFRKERTEEKGSDFLPPTFMLPISVVVGKVDASFRLFDVVALDEPHYHPKQITKKFWLGWRHYKRPTFVTFNGRNYDMPVLELAAFRYGLSLPDWFNVNARTYEQSRNRYNFHAHLDMIDLFSNFGAVHINGGLNLLAKLLKKAGKTGIDGSQIQDKYDAGELKEINDYCRCDVLDTYFVFLRTRVLLGQLSYEDEQIIMKETKAWLESQRETNLAYNEYLEYWGNAEGPDD